MKKEFIIIIALLSFSFYSFGCTCSFSGHFLEVSKRTELTVVAKITSKIRWKLNVEVEKVLGGRVDIDTISIIGDRNGMSCLKGLGGYLVGETYAFALFTDYEGENEYVLSNCGEYSLKIEEGQVKGMVNADHQDERIYWPRWNKKTMREEVFYQYFEKRRRGYMAPCRRAFKFEKSKEFSEEFERAKEAYQNGQAPSFLAYKKAIWNNNLPLVQFYLEKGDLAKEKKLSYLVSYAVESGNIDIVELFLKNEMTAKIEKERDFYFVHKAVLYPEILKLLHKSGAELNPKGYKGITTIMHAIKQGCIESISYLMDEGADLNETSDRGKKASDFIEFNKRNKSEVQELLESNK